MELGDVVAVHRRDGGKGWWAGTIRRTRTESSNGASSSAGSDSDTVVTERGWFPSDVVDNDPLPPLVPPAPPATQSSDQDAAVTGQPTAATAVATAGAASARPAVEPQPTRPASILSERLEEESDAASEQHHVQAVIHVGRTFSFPAAAGDGGGGGGSGGSGGSSGGGGAAESSKGVHVNQAVVAHADPQALPPQLPPPSAPTNGDTRVSTMLTTITESAMEVPLPLQSHGAWWEQPLDTIPWAALLPERDAVVSLRSESSSEDVGTRNSTAVYRFFLELADATKGKIEVAVRSNDNTSAVITDVWEDPPAARSTATLKRYSTRHCQAIIDFCTSKIGHQVGNGECWSLVDACLRSSNARPALLYNFGQEIDGADATVGDIFVLEQCRFEKKNAAGDVVRVQTAGSPKHCSVIQHVASAAASSGGAVSGNGAGGGSNSGDTLTVWEQNVGGSTLVVKSQYCLADMTEGKVRYFRALPNYPTLKGSLTVRGRRRAAAGRGGGPVSAVF